MAWYDTAAVKTQEIWKSVPKQWQMDSSITLHAPTEASKVHAVLHMSLSTSEQSITERTAADLLTALQHGDVSAVEVLAAFAHRAILAHELTRCLCENNLAAARQRASELDAYWRIHHAPIGALHGLPISLMDRFHVADLDSACGFSSWVGIKRSAKDEGMLVRALRSLGAVVHCKTNIPMSMMLGETTNNIIGTTVNPFNRNLSAGGACGGEGALIALRGSHLGFGTDLAGSSRIPSVFCGLWALKCSEGRLPHDGIATVLSGLPIASGAVGLMSSERTLLTTALKALLTIDLSQSDPDVIDLPWRPEMIDSIRRRKGSPKLADGRLVFGIMAWDGHVQPHPSIRRAISIVTIALQKSGHEIVEWNPPSHHHAVNNLFQIFGSTSAIEARKALDASGEPPVPQLADWYQNLDIEPSTTSEFWELCAQLCRYRTQYKVYWNRVGESTRSGRVPDGVILPVVPSLAVRPCEFSYYGYAAIANVLDYPSGVFPVTSGDCKLDITPTNLSPLNDVDEKVQKSCMCQRWPDTLEVREANQISTLAVHPSDIQGLPVGLQVMCPRLQEEKVLCLMEAIAESLEDARCFQNAVAGSEMR